MKILFADLDDTLLSSDKTISENNLLAIREMTKKGHAFVLNTGRPLYSALKLAREYDFVKDNFYISAYNGGQLYDIANARELYHEGITYDVVDFLFKEAARCKLHVQTYNDDCILVQEDSEYIKWYSGRIKMPYKVVDNVLTALEKEPLKCIVAHMTDHDRLVAFQKEIGTKLSDVTQNLFSNPILLEFGSLKASKGIAVRKLCELLKVPVSDSIAVGDEENDISMIEAAGTGIAMTNGVESVRKVANIITENDNNHDAIAEIINRFILLK